MGVTPQAAKQGPHRFCGDAPDGRGAPYAAANAVNISPEIAWAQ